MAVLMRQKLVIALLTLFTFIAFAASGSDTWISWTIPMIFLSFGLLMDCMFSQESSFVFDPDAENWRRKTDQRY